MEFVAVGMNRTKTQSKHSIASIKVPTLPVRRISHENEFDGIRFHAVPCCILYSIPFSSSFSTLGLVWLCANNGRKRNRIIYTRDHHRTGMGQMHGIKRGRKELAIIEYYIRFSHFVCFRTRSYEKVLCLNRSFYTCFAFLFSLSLQCPYEI